MHDFTPLVNYLAHSALVLTVLGVAAWLGDRLLRRVGPAAQHRVWVAALLAGVVLPLVPAGWLAELGSSGSSAGGDTATVTYDTIATAAERWTVSPWMMWTLAGAYGLIVLFALTRLIWRLGKTRAMARRTTEFVPNARAARLLFDSGVATVKVRCSVETCGPVVLGPRALLIVPDCFFDAPEDDVAAALAHECAHIARRDFAKNLFYEFVAAFISYHPVSWWMRRRIAETRELICDEMAAGVSGDRAEYAASLLRLAQSMAVPAMPAGYAIGVFDGNILETRIMQLTMDLPKVSRLRKVAIVVVAACALLGGAFAAAAVPFDVTPQEKVYKVGGDVKPPVLIHSVDAEFTKKAKDAKYQGVSVVSCVVGTDGIPRQVHTTRKLGMGLDEKAIDAVRQYRFEPGTLNGKPVAVAIAIEVNFRLY
jgi:beta-lactamase regulating signal transducer with metallopeptidase domain